MKLGPLIFRVASWPVETLQDLCSTTFTASVDCWIQEGFAICEQGCALSDKLYTLVPLIADRRFRAEILALRRALHRNAEPVVIPTGIANLVSEDLTTDLTDHACRRNRHAEARLNFEASYVLALESERAALECIVSKDDFQKALCLASPGSTAELRKQKTHFDWRLTRTLVQFVLRAVGRPTPNGLWAGVSLERTGCERGLEVEPKQRIISFAPRLAYLERAFQSVAPRGKFPVIYEDAWEALAGLLPQLPPSFRSQWECTIARLRELCCGLNARFTDLSADEFQKTAWEAHAAVSGLLLECGLGVVHPDDCVLVADCTTPFSFRVSDEVRQRIEWAIGNTWHFDRLGTGQRDAEARRLGQPQPDMTASWECELASVYWESRYCLNGEGEPGTMPPGTALLRLDNAIWGLRVGCIAPDPALFYGRFHHLFRDRSEFHFFDWYRGELRMAESKQADLAFADLGIDHPSDWNAAARPMFTPFCIDPEASELPSSCTVPLISSAVSLHKASDFVQALANATHLMGRPSLLRPMPCLPKERSEWKHLPRLELSGGITIGAERWMVPQDLVAQLKCLQGVDRFIEWRRYVIGNHLSDLVYSITGQENTESLLPCSSVLSVEVLVRAITGRSAELRLQEAYPDPRTAWLTDSNGQHYVSEVAASWVGDDRFWSEYVASNTSVREGSHVL